MNIRGTQRLRCVAEVMQRIANKAEELEMELDRRVMNEQQPSLYELDTIADSFAMWLENIQYGKHGCVSIRYNMVQRRHEIRFNIKDIAEALEINSSLVWLP